MKQRSNGRGWRRIGIVLSVIWFVGFFGWVWVYDNNHHSDFYSLMVRGCYEILDTNNSSRQYIRDENERERKRDANRAKFRDCENRASADLVAALNKSHSALAIGLLSAIDLVIIGIAWLIALATVGVVRWIIRGFEAAA